MKATTEVNTTYFLISFSVKKRLTSDEIPVYHCYPGYRCMGTMLGSTAKQIHLKKYYFHINLNGFLNTAIFDVTQKKI